MTNELVGGLISNVSKVVLYLINIFNASGFWSKYHIIKLKFTAKYCLLHFRDEGDHPVMYLNQVRIYSTRLAEVRD